MVGGDEFLAEELEPLAADGRYRFHRLFEAREIFREPCPAPEDLAVEADRRLSAADVPVHGLVAQWDFPVTSLVPWLQRRYRLPGPNPEAVAKCTNKYWSRLVQREAVPASTPDFQLLDPFAEGVLRTIELPFPFWLKPVKSFASQLGFRIDDADQLRAALERIRTGLPEIGDAYDDMQRLLLGSDHPRIGDGTKVLIEEIVGGREIADESTVQAGEISCNGLIDMPREAGSFDRYQYPATVDTGLAERIATTTRALIGHIGLDDTCFNIEYFYDEAEDRLSVIEINPRMSPATPDRPTCRRINATRTAAPWCSTRRRCNTTSNSWAVRASPCRCAATVRWGCWRCVSATSARTARSRGSPTAC